MCGGRNCEAPIMDLHVLNLETNRWEVMMPGGVPPQPLYTHAACAIPSATSYKLFLFGGMKSSWNYSSTVFCLDPNTKTWDEPQVECSEKQGRMHALPEGCEGTAHCFDSKSGHIFFFGGWNSRRLSSVLSLDCTGIVGPPYAVQSTEPKVGPLSGGRALIVKGLNFVAGKVEVMFTSMDKSKEEKVSGKMIDSSTISCTTPSFEAHGAQTVQIKVAINGQLFTLNRVTYDYFDDTAAENCIAYGPGLNTCIAGKPAKFVVRAMDTKKQRRTSGRDTFDVEAVWNAGAENEMPFKGRCKQSMEECTGWRSHAAERCRSAARGDQWLVAVCVFYQCEGQQSSDGFRHEGAGMVGCGHEPKG